MGVPDGFDLGKQIAATHSLRKETGRTVAMSVYH